MIVNDDFKLKVKRLTQTAKLPDVAHEGDLGYDVYSDEDVTIEAGKTKVVSTGIAIQWPEGIGCFVKDRSSIAAKKNVFTAAGVIDWGYTGNIGVVMYNSTEYDVIINSGDKIAQLVPILIPVIDGITEVDDFEITSRNSDGFGSTGE